MSQNRKPQGPPRNYMESPGYKLVRRFGGDVQLGLYMHNKEVLESWGKFVSLRMSRI